MGWLTNNPYTTEAFAMVIWYISVIIMKAGDNISHTSPTDI